MTSRTFLARLLAHDSSRDSSPPLILRACPNLAPAFAVATLPIGPAVFPFRASQQFAACVAALYNPPDRTAGE